MKKKSISIVLASILSLSAAAGLSTSAMALGFSDIIDAAKGHVSDAVGRITHDDEIAQGITLSTSSFRDDDPGRDSVHYVNGTVSIVMDHDKYYVQLHEDFEAGFAPDLYLYVANYKVIDEASLSEYTEIAKLKSGSGAQIYEIPELYSEVIIWCKRFNQYMGAATL